MTIKRRSNLFFGTTEPRNPRSTYLWINTENNTISSYDDSWSTLDLTSPGSPSDPNLSLGTLSSWTDNTIWYTAGDANPMGNQVGSVRPIIQVMYAHRPIKISNGSATSLGIYANQSGGTFRWQVSVSNTDNLIGDFSSPVFTSASLGSSPSTAGEVKTGNMNAEFIIPAKRYFLIIRSPGPLYTASTASPGNGGLNRTATINNVPIFTTLSYTLLGSSTSTTNQVTDLPTQLGGTDNGYFQRNDYNPAFGITFTLN